MSNIMILGFCMFNENNYFDMEQKLSRNCFFLFVYYKINGERNLIWEHWYCIILWLGFQKFPKNNRNVVRVWAWLCRALAHAQHVCCALRQRASASIRAQPGEYAQFELLSRRVHSLVSVSSIFTVMMIWWWHNITYLARLGVRWYTGVGRVINRKHSPGWEAYRSVRKWDGKSSRFKNFCNIFLWVHHRNLSKMKYETFF